MNFNSLTPAQQSQMLAKQGAENSFIDAMANSNARYYISGHNHHNDNSIVTSPDGTSSVHQIISQSDSSKFYTPSAPYSANETPIAQQLNQIGYYIYTINGPRVTVDYYAAPASAVDSQGLSITSGGNPTYNFQKVQTFGYSLNGKEFLIQSGGNLTRRSQQLRFHHHVAGWPQYQHQHGPRRPHFDRGDRHRLDRPDCRLRFGRPDPLGHGRDWPARRPARSP